MPAARLARELACEVWLPPCLELHGTFLPELPQVTSHFSHGMSSVSAATRAVSNTESVPRLPTPCWMYSFPSGRIVSSPSKPMVPAEKLLRPTPSPVTFVPRRTPLRNLRSFHLKSAAPLSSASRANAPVSCGRFPRALGGPKADPVI